MVKQSKNLDYTLVSIKCKTCHQPFIICIPKEAYNLYLEGNVEAYDLGIPINTAVSLDFKQCPNCLSLSKRTQ